MHIVLAPFIVNRWFSVLQDSPLQLAIEHAITVPFIGLLSIVLKTYQIAHGLQFTKTFSPNFLWSLFAKVQAVNYATKKQTT